MAASITDKRIFLELNGENQVEKIKWLLKIFSF